MVGKENWRIFEMRKLNVAIIGQGRSGRDIHGAFLLTPANDTVNSSEVNQTISATLFA